MLFSRTLYDDTIARAAQVSTIIFHTVLFPLWLFFASQLKRIDEYNDLRFSRLTLFAGECFMFSICGRFTR
jgi:hypothetical protein